MRILGQMVIFALMSSAAMAASADAGYDPHGMKDPFLPLVTAAGAIVTYDNSFSVAEMSLEGVIIDEDGGAAVINGNIVEQGRMIGLYKVERVEADRVILLKDGQESLLQLKKEE